MPDSRDKRTDDPDDKIGGGIVRQLLDLFRGFPDRQRKAQAEADEFERALREKNARVCRSDDPPAPI